MSRRNRAVKRLVPPDPRYDSQTVSKFICNLMERGKKGLAERVFYSAMDMIEQRTSQPGVTVFKQALSNAKPAVEVKSRRVGGASLQPKRHVGGSSHRRGEPSLLPAAFRERYPAHGELRRGPGAVHVRHRRVQDGQRHLWPPRRGRRHPEYGRVRQEKHPQL